MLAKKCLIQILWTPILLLAPLYGQATTASDTVDAFHTALQLDEKDAALAILAP